MAEIWGAVAAAAVSVGGSMVAANNSKKKGASVADGALVNLQDQQKDAITGNLLAQGDIETLLNKSNNYTQKSAIDLMNQAVPGYSDFANGLMQSGRDKLANPYALPDDVTENLNRISAERGISRGTAGQTNQYSALRDLGVNMLDYGDRNFQQAIQALTTVTGTAPRISPMSPMSFYVTPNQNAAVAAGNASVLQGAQNSATAAQNVNQANLWDTISKGIGGIANAGATAYGDYQNSKTPTPTTDMTYGSSGTGYHG